MKSSERFVQDLLVCQSAGGVMTGRPRRRAASTLALPRAGPPARPSSAGQTHLLVLHPRAHSPSSRMPSSAGRPPPSRGPPPTPPRLPALAEWAADPSARPGSAASGAEARHRRCPSACGCPNAWRAPARCPAWREASPTGPPADWCTAGRQGDGFRHRLLQSSTRQREQPPSGKGLGQSSVAPQEAPIAATLPTAVSLLEPQ